MSARPADIDEYLAAAPEAARAVLGRLRQIVASVAPEAVESVSNENPT
jgi:uncharacterized protein YdhG (YjbR/CyaY superfamily)